MWCADGRYLIITGWIEIIRKEDFVWVNVTIKLS